MNNKERMAVARRVSFVSIVVNIGLSVLKILIGYIGRSTAIVADGLHSLSDVFSTIVALLGIKLSSREDDEDHPYGHEKFEPIMGKILANILILTALYMAYTGFRDIYHGNYTRPNTIALIAAVVSIIVKEWMYHYTIKAATKIESSAMKADAWHHRTDAISSIGSLIGVGGAIIGFKIMDPLMAILISLMIGKVGVDIYMKAITELVDKAVDDDVLDDMKATIMNVDGVKSIDNIKTRIHANRIYVDVEISVDEKLSLIKAHDISEMVHDEIEGGYTKVKHCMVHVNPYRGS